MTYKEISLQFGVGKEQIHRIKVGKAWSYLQKEGAL